MITIILLLINNIQIIIGPIFCQVNNIKHLIHSSPLITSGNQKWNGAIPNFINNAENVILYVKK